MPVSNATLNSGVEASTDNTGNNPIDMANVIAELEPNQAPFVALLTKLRKSKATNPKVQWQEDRSMPWLTTLSASATSAATALGVTADIFRVGDLVRITETGEAIEVTATAAGAITATRAIGDNAAGDVDAASATSAAELFIVGNVNAEGSTLREIKYPQLSTVYNYCEIFRTPFGVTGTEDATEHYGGDERARLRAKFGKEHVRNIERTFFFGARDLNSTNKRFCGGIKEFISTNVTADSGGLTEDEFNTFLRTGFRYGSERKVLFASPKVMSAVNGYARANLQVNDNRAETYGVNMKTYVSPHGVVDLVMHRDWLDSSVLGGYAFLVDMDNVELKTLRDTKLLPNRQAPDYDGFKDEYLSEITLKVAQEATHALLTGVT